MNLSKRISSKKSGFTLIELLIVVGILGILAIGLLAALDPIEQLRKGRDTTKKSVARELNDAAVRHYGTTGVPPWGAVAMGAAALTSSSQDTAITAMITSGELKSSFKQGIASVGSSITMAGAANGDVSVCFVPESKSDRTNYTSLFSGTAVNAAVCANLAAAQAGNCYFCAR